MKNPDRVGKQREAREEGERERIILSTTMDERRRNVATLQVWAKDWSLGCVNPAS